MRCNVKINGKDALANWGVTLADGGINALILPAQAKEYVSNESRLNNGKEVLSAKRLYSDRDVSLTFNVYAKDLEEFYANVNSFIDELMKGTSDIVVNYLPNATFKLDYISSSQLSQLRGEIGKIIVKFNEPNPTER